MRWARCPKCKSAEFYTDPADPFLRHCIPCENGEEERTRRNKGNWDKKRPPRKRDRAKMRAYDAAYRARKRERK